MAIYLYIGEDNLSLDKQYLEFRQHYQEVQFIEIFNRLTLENKVANFSFFPEKKLFVTKNIFLNQVRVGKVSQGLAKDLKLLSGFLGDNDFLFWEEDSKKQKYYEQFFPNLIVKEFKITPYLFSFLDNFIPKNLNRCYELWHKTLLQNPAELVLYLLRRRVRELLLVSTNSLSGRYQSWQLAKFKKQLQSWSISRLKHLYQSFYRYEKGLKTGTNPFTAKQFLETVLALYL